MSRKPHPTNDVPEPLTQALGIDTSPLWVFHRNAAFEERMATHATPTHIDILNSLRTVVNQRKQARAKFIGKTKVLKESAKQSNMDE